MKVAEATKGSEKPILLFILTDGEPNGGSSRFCSMMRSAMSDRTKFKVQIMACTSDDEAVGWLNIVDREFKTVDCTDDYYSEKREVIRAGRTPRFTRGDWCLKAMLGPISSKFDGWDERKHVGSASPAGPCADCAIL